MPTNTADFSEEINLVASNLSHKIKGAKSSEKAVAVVRKWLNDNAYDKSYTPPRPYRVAKNLLESRNTKASELIGRPMASCGSQTTLGTALLRSMGYKVKMVHGKHPKSHHHAWISIYDEASKSWQEFDFTGYGFGPAGDITPQHSKQLECEDWSDIQDLLKEEHANYLKNRH